MRSKLALRLLALTPLLCLAWEGRAAAQTARGFAIDRFEPSDRGSEWFAVDSLDLRGKARPMFGVVGDWGVKPLVSYDSSGHEAAAIIQHQLVTHLGGSVNLFERLRLSANLPIAVFQSGTDVSAGGQLYAAPSSAFGDLRLGADVRLFGVYGDPLTAALGADVHLPTGSRDNYMSDGTVRVDPHLLVAGDVGAVAYALRGGVNVRPLTDDFAQKPLGSQLAGGAAVGIRVADRKLVVGPEIYAATGIDSDAAFFKKRTTPVEGLLGAHYTAGDFRVGGGMGIAITRALGEPVVRGLLSLEYVPEVASDEDKDGVRDADDACPTVPGVHTEDPKTNGCPKPAAPPADRDKDGIPDAEDACRDLPGPQNADASLNGCPDKDKDGLIDPVDACPSIPGERSSDPEKNGCPPDRDKDGVADGADACPDVPGVKTDDVKTNGCPADKDLDGIPDKEDACMEVPGPKDPDPKKNGCPAVRVEAGQLKIREQVKFKTNSAEIVDSDAILTAVADAMREHPEIAKLRVEGHTDNRGEPGYNKFLSRKRALEVTKWLTAHGVRWRRLSFDGYGMERPIDSNDTEEGRANNRRVEFHIEGDDGSGATATEKDAPAPANDPDAPKKAAPKAPKK